MSAKQRKNKRHKNKKRKELLVIMYRAAPPPVMVRDHLNIISGPKTSLVHKCRKEEGA